MIRLHSAREHVKLIERHQFICDLLHLDGPLLSLYREQRLDWLYLWADTDGERSERWMLFPAARITLVRYLSKQVSLRGVINALSNVLFLDVRAAEPDDDGNQRSPHRVLRRVPLEELPEQYLPAKDSFFDDSLAADIELGRHFEPETFKVPIDGEWFASSFEEFFRLYSQVYAFLYCTTPQFVANVGQRIERYLRSPWTGGYSRVNLFLALERMIPSFHDLRIKGLQYGSPGTVSIEALKPVGEMIVSTLTSYRAHESELLDLEKGLNSLLTTNHLRRVDLSNVPDERLNLTDENRAFLQHAIGRIGRALGVQTAIRDLGRHSPNVIVTAKAVASLVSRVRRLNEFEANGLVQLSG